MSSVPFCVNCRHHELAPDRFPGSDIHHWCAAGIDMVTGQVIKVNCQQSRAATVPFQLTWNAIGYDWSTGSPVIDPCGHQAKFFEPIA